MKEQLPLKPQLWAIGGSILLFLFVLELVRRRRLREEYSILWMGVSFGIALLAVWGDLLIGIKNLLGAYSANSVIFFFGLFFLMSLVLHLTVRVSELSEQNKDLAQQAALLMQRIEEGERSGRT